MNKDTRRKAEMLLKKENYPLEDLTVGKDLAGVIRELQLHQIELTLQNEELQRIQNELEQTRNKYIDLYNFAPIGYLTLTQDGHILQINLTGAELLGEDQNHLKGKAMTSYLSHEARPIFGSHVQEVLASEQPQTCELCLNQREANPIYVQIKSVFDRREGHLRSTLIDMSDRKQAEDELKRINEHLLKEIAEREQAEQALQRRNRELELLNWVGHVFSSSLELDHVLTTILEEVRSLLKIVGCSIWLVDPETNDLVCRQATGLQSDLVRNRRLKPGEGIAGWVVSNNQSLIVPDTQADTRHFARINKQVGLEIRSIVSVPLQIKDKVIGALQVVDTPVDRFNENDLRLVEALSPAAAIAIENARLYTERKQAEAELQNRNEDLDAFAHMVAHDLKNPLGVTVGIAEILTADLEDIPMEDLKNYLTTIAQSGRKARNIVEELLMLASVRQKEIKLKPVDMDDILVEAQRRLTDFIAKSGTHVSVPDHWPSALGHAPWIEEVWVNYLSNAMKYGGQPPRIELGATIQDDAFIHFWIKDNGAGLTQEEQAQLFKPFTELNQVRATGHGLGLSIVRRIVEKLGGQVTVQSQPGQGSTFGFTLPSAGEEKGSEHYRK
jgi:signal transduction histidine kinase/PAS domain-containing protein